MIERLSQLYSKHGRHIFLWARRSVDTLDQLDTCSRYIPQMNFISRPTNTELHLEASIVLLFQAGHRYHFYSYLFATFTQSCFTTLKCTHMFPCSSKLAARCHTTTDVVWCSKDSQTHRTIVYPLPLSLISYPEWFSIHGNSPFPRFIFSDPEISVRHDSDHL